MHELSPTRFREEVARYIGPIKGSYGQGMHTMSAVGELTLVDGKRYVHNKAQEERVRKRKWDRLRSRHEDEDPEDEGS